MPRTINETVWNKAIRLLCWINCIQKDYNKNKILLLQEHTNHLENPPIPCQK